MCSFGMSPVHGRCSLSSVSITSRLVDVASKLEINVKSVTQNPNDSESSSLVASLIAQPLFKTVSLDLSSA